MKKNKDRLYVIQKYVWAKTSKEAMRKEKFQHADDVYIDSKWKEVFLHEERTSQMGFIGNKKTTK